MMNKKVKSLDDNILFGVFGAGRSDDRENPTESSQKRKQLMATGRSALPAILSVSKINNKHRTAEKVLLFLLRCLQLGLVPFGRNSWLLFSAGTELPCRHPSQPKQKIFKDLFDGRLVL
jgi:hypothetical protein